MKKIYIILLILISISSCGKKGDPIYNEETKNLKILSTQQSTIS